MFKKLSALPVLAFIALIEPLQALRSRHKRRPPRSHRKDTTGQATGTCGAMAMVGIGEWALRSCSSLPSCAWQ